MSLFVAVPYTRPHFNNFLESLLFTQKPAGQLIFKSLYGMDLQTSRNSLAEQFLNHPAKPEYLIFIDNDATWHPSAFKRLLDHNLPMISGCMYMKELPPRPTMGKLIGKTRSGNYQYNFGETAKEIIRIARDHELDQDLNNLANDLILEKLPAQDYLYEVSGCGMHFTLIRRDVFEAIEQPYFLFQNKVAGGEDFYFCRKVKKAGIPIYADLGLHTGHLAGEECDFGIRELLKMSAPYDLENILPVTADMDLEMVVEEE